MKNNNQLHCTATYNNTTIILFDEKYDNKTYYYLGIYHNYNDLKNSNCIKMIEYTEKEKVLDAYKYFVTIIDIL